MNNINLNQVFFLSKWKEYIFIKTDKNVKFGSK